MGELINSISEFQKKIYSEYLEEQLPRLNLLDQWKHRYENSHSKVLANLLDPNEAHRQKDMFLKLFLEEFIENLSEKSWDLEKVAVKCEHVIPKSNRRIDIFIKINKDTCIIIENKIDAGDQKKQLKDYLKYAEENYKNNYVLYLTKNGKEPSQESLGDLTPDKIDEIICISYKDNILKWLCKCKKALGKSSVNDTDGFVSSALIQYEDTIKGIVKQRKGMDEMKEKMIQELLKNFNDLNNDEDRREQQIDELRNLRDSVNIVLRGHRSLQVLDELIEECPNYELYYDIPEDNPSKIIEIKELTAKLQDEYKPFYFKISLADDTKLSVEFAPKGEKFFASVGFLKIDNEKNMLDKYKKLLDDKTNSIWLAVKRFKIGRDSYNGIKKIIEDCENYEEKVTK